MKDKIVDKAVHGQTTSNKQIRHRTLLFKRTLLCLVNILYNIRILVIRFIRRTWKTILFINKIYKTYRIHEHLSIIIGIYC